MVVFIATVVAVHAKKLSNAATAAAAPVKLVHHDGAAIIIHAIIAAIDQIIPTTASQSTCSYRSSLDSKFHNLNK